MYEQVCSHFKKDPQIGIDWLSAFALWKQSNPNASSSSSSTTTSTSPKKAKSPPPKQSPTKSQKTPLRRLKTSTKITTASSPKKATAIGSMGTLSPTKSTGQLYTKKKHTKNNESFSGSSSQLTERNLRQLNGASSHSLSKSMNMNDDDQQSIDSEQSFRSQRRHRREISTDRRDRQGSFDDHTDASQMVVQMMESKVKKLQNQVKLERAKRKKTEELAQSLLTQNEEYKKQMVELNASQTKMKNENKTFKDQLRKLKTIVDDDRQTIKHLNQQRNAMKAERDESFTLLTKIEKEHSMMVKKEKNKHKTEMEKLSTGFLQVCLLLVTLHLT